MYFDIEDNPMTANGSVVFKHVTLPKFFYMDKPGNWISGNEYCCVISRRRTNISKGTEIGKARGSLRSSPKEKEGKSLACPCQVKIDLEVYGLFFLYFRQVLGSFMKMGGRMTKQFPSLNVKINYNQNLGTCINSNQIFCRI